MAHQHSFIDHFYNYLNTTTQPKTLRSPSLSSSVNRLSLVPLLLLVICGLFNNNNNTAACISAIMEAKPLKIYDQVPDFELAAVDKDSKEFTFKLSQSLVNSDYVILMFYPSDFTFVCPTEVRSFNEKLTEFRDSYKTELIAISTDSVHSHKAWKQVGKEFGGLGVDIQMPLASDRNHRVSKMFNILDESAGTAYRGLFIIDKNQTLIYSLISADNVGRNVDESIRVMDALKRIKSTPGNVCLANYKVGGETVEKSFESVSKDL